MRNFFTIVFLSMILFSCKEATPALQYIKGDAFGTTYSIQYFSVDKQDVEKGIDSVIYRVNKSVSTYLPGSDISKINQGDTTLVVDEIFKDVFQLSKEVHGLSKGFFDPTVGVLRNAYGFGDEEALNKIDKTVLDSLRRFVGFKKVTLNRDGTVSKQLPQIYLDFNAVAKGYGIDLIGAYLQKEGITDFVIELGGELLARGTHRTKNKPWVAGVEGANSALDNRTAIAKVALTDKGMAGSGNYRKFRIDPVTGRKFVHTINPHSGLAEENNVTSATVIANSCAKADAYATAFMAMGLDNSKRLLNELSDVEVYLTYQNGKGETKEFVSAGFNRLLIK